MSKLGRPSTYTPEIATEICNRLAGGQSLVSICRETDMPGQTAVFQWLHLHADFAKKYAQARESWADAEFERMMEIADTPRIGVKTKTYADGSTEETEGDMVDHRKLQIDTRKWALARMSPRKYGDKIQQEITNPDGSLGDPTDVEAAAKRLEAIQRRALQRKKEASADAGADHTDLC